MTNFSKFKNQPTGCIELGNGAKNLELKVLYNVIE